MADPIFISSNFQITYFLEKISRGKAVINVVRLLFAAVKEKSWMIFFALFLV